MTYQNRIKRTQKQLSRYTMSRQSEAEVNECPTKTKPRICYTDEFHKIFKETITCQIIKLLEEHRRTLWPWLTFTVGGVVQWEVPALHDKVLGLKLQLENSKVSRNKWTQTIRKKKDK